MKDLHYIVRQFSSEVVSQPSVIRPQNVEVSPSERDTTRRSLAVCNSTGQPVRLIMAFQ